MKQKVFYAFLITEAVLCILIYSAQAKFSGVFTAVLAFPFEQIGIVLRALSLSTTIGNAVAIVVYVFVSLTPVLFLLNIRRKRKLYPEDSLLIVLTVLLFPVLYLMINPGKIGSYLVGSDGLSVGKAIIGGIVYSVLFGYVVLRILRLFFEADTRKLERYIAAILYLLNVIFIFIAFGTSFGDFLTGIDTLKAGNVGNEHLLGASYLFLAFQYIVDALPFILNVLVVFSILTLLKELKKDRYSEITLEAAGKLSHLCGLTLAITVLSNMTFNLLQFVFAKSLRVINGVVQIPVFPIAFILATLLLAQFIRENKQLKDDNDMFI